jgi:hypothetical protein
MKKFDIKKKIQKFWWSNFFFQRFMFLIQTFLIWLQKNKLQKLQKNWKNCTNIKFKVYKGRRGVKAVKTRGRIHNFSLYL